MCKDYRKSHFTAELRDTGLPFGYLNAGLYVAYASFLQDVFYRCFTVKAETEHRGKHVPRESSDYVSGKEELNLLI